MAEPVAGERLIYTIVDKTSLDHGGAFIEDVEGDSAVLLVEIVRADGEDSCEALDRALEWMPPTDFDVRELRGGVLCTLENGVPLPGTLEREFEGRRCQVTLTDLRGGPVDWLQIGGTCFEEV